VWPPWSRVDDGIELTGERLAVLVHHRLEAEAAIALAAEAGLEVELVLPVGLVGPAFAAALEAGLGRSIVAYCDDRPGLALESLRVGLKRLVLETGLEASTAAETAAETAAAERLADIARQQGAALATALPAPLYRLAADGRRLLPATLGATGGLVP
jgi:hypothetical protein